MCPILIKASNWCFIKIPLIGLLEVGQYEAAMHMCMEFLYNYRAGRFIRLWQGEGLVVFIQIMMLAGPVFYDLWLAGKILVCGEGSFRIGEPMTCSII